MEEEGQKVCLVEVPLEIGEKMPLQIQMQLLEEMQDLEALEAEAGAEAEVEKVIFLVLVANQQEMVAKVGLVVMEVVAGAEEREGTVLITMQEQEMQEVLAVLEEGAEEVEMLGLVDGVVEVMVQQEAMAEVEAAVESEAEAEEVLLVLEEVAPLVALD